MPVPSIARRALICTASLLMTLSLPLLAQTTPPSNGATSVSPIRWTVNGYVQGRFSKNLGKDTAHGTFEARRAYLNLGVDVNEHISAGIMVSGVPTVSVKEAFGEYRFNPSFRARLGLTRIPFGYELPLSSSRLITLERSQVVSSLLADEFTFERGLFAYYTPVGKPYSLQAALTNGTNADTPTDPNGRKNAVARLGYVIPGGQVGASVYDGSNATDQNMQRYGVDVQVTRGAFTVQSEALKGRTGAVDAAGAYVTLAYREPGTATQPYLRLDTFDPNTDTSGNNFRRVTVGLSYFLKDNTRVTAEYQRTDDDTGVMPENAAAVQYQVSF